MAVDNLTIKHLINSKTFLSHVGRICNFYRKSGFENMEAF